MRELIIMIIVCAIILMAISIPLRNYFHQRSEITRLNSAISSKQEQKDKLAKELEKYHSKAYQEEQARQRFDVIRPGEKAYRIQDPAMDNVRKAEDLARQEQQSHPWYEVMWSSITEPATDLVLPGTQPAAEKGTEAPAHLPLQPAE